MWGSSAAWSVPSFWTAVKHTDMLAAGGALMLSWGRFWEPQPSSLQAIW